MTQKQIKGYECKFATYVENQFTRSDDVLVVKENIHYDDGTTEPNLRYIRNYKRSFYTTLPGHQNHKEKKDCELLSRLRKTECTQIELNKRVAQAIGQVGNKNPRLKMLARNQYLYGCDVTTPTLIKEKYNQKWPDLMSESTVAVVDAETDVLTESDEIILLSVTYKDKVFCAALNRFFDGMEDVEAKVREKFSTYLGEYEKSRNIKLEFMLVDTAGQATYEVIQRLHKWKPDFATTFNLDFDMSKMISALEADNYHLPTVFSDPGCPKEYRYFEYAKGHDSVTTASGKSRPLGSHEQWHTVIAPSSFYWICSMASYAFIRKAKGNEPSYNLDDILNRNLKLSKLKFDAVKSIKLQWHIDMQRGYKIEYVIYNIFDCIGVELLQEKTKDLLVTVPQLCGYSEFRIFNSNPKLLADALHFFFLNEEGSVIASVSDQMKNELDENVVSMRKWIITLKSYLTEDYGIKLFKDYPNLVSLVWAFVADLDVKSSYPYTQIFANIARDTRMMELASIEGVSDDARRLAGINLTGGKVNAVEFCQMVYNATSLYELYEGYMEQKNPVIQVPNTSAVETPAVALH